MKKRILLLFSLLLAAAFVLSSCAQPATNLMAGVHAAEWPASPAEPDSKFTGAVSDFSWRLFQESTKNSGNVLISPASVYFALAMTLNGADQDTRTAMLKALSANGLTVDELNKSCRDWATLLMNTNKTTKLSIANSIWYRDGFAADKDFLQRNADFYAAAAKTLDFDQEDSVKTINAWVKDATKGTIDKILDKINPEVMMYLINAVYFKADWQTQFDAAKTAAGKFAAPAGEVDVKYLSRTDSMDYLQADDGEGILLPYKDGRYAFMAILPNEGTAPRDLVLELTAEKAAAMLQGRKTQSVDLRLPKFETRYEDSLLDELKTLGMEVAFDPDQADFSLMNAAHAKNLYISEVKHKTFCRVDELGTEAAAVTSVEVKLTSMPASDHQLNFNRPFIYGIVDTTTGAPLFLGIMENPAAQ